MTIGIDLRILANDANTGVEEYTKKLLSFLIPLNKNIKYKLFYNAYRKKELNYEWANASNVEIAEFKIPNKFLEISGRSGFPKIDKLLKGADVFFQPHFLPAVLSGQCKRVITFHDLSFERYPEFFSWRKKMWHKRVCPQKQAKRADKIIAVSQSTKEDLVNLYSINSGKIKVIHSGIDSDFFSNDIGSERIEAIKSKYGLPENFILFLGTLEPRKNVLGAIKAFELLKDKNKENFSDLKFVIAGSRGWLYKELFGYVENSKYKNDIIFVGKILDSEKKILYKLSKIFVFPSFFEGFGFPPLEAMSCGTPVVTSNTSSLPEVVGDGAMTVDPYRIDEMADAMESVLKDGNLRRKLVEKGKKQAQKFSWEKCAEETLKHITHNT